MIPESRTKVLLIEDPPGGVRLIRESPAYAQDGAFQVECADCLSEGLARLSQGGIDVTLLDLGLPDSTVLDTLAAVRAHAPHVAIVVLTGLADQQAGTQPPGGVTRFPGGSMPGLG